MADTNWTTVANWNADTLPPFNGTDAITLDAINASGTALQLNGDKNIGSLSTTPSQTYSLNGNTLTIQSGAVISNLNGATITYNSNVAVGANATFNLNNSGAMVINGAISDGGSGYSVTKNGSGQLTLAGANSYTGQTIFNGGTLYVGADVAENTPSPMGNASSAVVMGQTGSPVTLVLPNFGQSFGRDIEISALGSGNARIDSYAGAGTTTLSGDILLGHDPTIYANQNGGGGRLNITGVISGSGNLAVHRNVRLAGVNTYTGTTTIGEHPDYPAYLGADATNGAPGAFGNATSDVVLQNSGLNIDGAYTVGRNMSLTGNVYLDQSAAGSGTFNGTIDMPNATTITLFTGSGNLIFTGAITGAGSILRNGGQGCATYFNNANNSYTGTTEIRIGDIIVGANAPSGSNGALGNATSAVLFNQLNVAHNSGLFINGAFDIGRDINIANPVLNAVTTLGGVSADNSSFSGNVAVNSLSTANLTAVTGGVVTFSGQISGAGQLNKVDAGTVVLSSASGNTYTGLTTVTSGVLVAAANSALGTTGSNTVVNNGATLGFQGNVNYSALEAVSVLGAGASSLGAIRNISGNNTFAGQITMTNSTTLGSDAGKLTLTNNLTDGAGTFNVTKVGAGTIDLTSSTGNTYNGTTSINAGTLLANNSTGSATGTGPVSIFSGGTLGGAGLVDGNVFAAAGGKIAPGNSPGTLTIDGDVAFTNSASEFVVELADSACDRLVVNGTVTLNGATLSGSVFGGINETSKLFILDNDGGDAIIGTFNGLSNGSIVNLGLFFGQSATAHISYFGDLGTNSITGGNDIVLYNFAGTSVPEPGTCALMLLGLGALVARKRNRKQVMAA